MLRIKYLAAITTLIAVNWIAAGCASQAQPPAAPAAIPAASATASPIPQPTATATPVPVLKLRAMTMKIACGLGANLDAFVKCEDSPYAIGGVKHTPDEARALADQAYDRVVKIVNSANPDILTLGEAEFWAEGESPYIEKFSKAVNMPYYYLPPNEWGDTSNAILSKYPIIETERMPQGMIDGSPIARAVVQTPDGERLNVYMLVLQSSITTRVCEFAAFIRAFPAGLPQRSLVMGHFQTCDDLPDVKPFHQAGWVSVQAVDPNLGILPDLADNIYVQGSKSWSADNLCFAEKPGCMPSLQFDNTHHYPAGADIYFYDRPTAEPVKTEPAAEIPAQVSAVLQGIKPGLVETYHDQCAFLPWEQSNHTKVDHDLLITTIGSEDWSGGTRRRTRLAGNQASILRFRYTPGSEFNIELSDGRWDTAEYRSFGIYNKLDQFSIQFWHGKNSNPGNNTRILQAKPGEWYDLLLAVGPDGAFRAVLWEVKNPQVMVVYKLPASKDWVRPEWTNNIGLNTGQVEIESFTPLTFEGFK